MGMSINSVLKAVSMVHSVDVPCLIAFYLKYLSFPVVFYLLPHKLLKMHLFPNS